MRPLVSAATGLLLALTLTGCGGDDDGTADDTPTHPTTASPSPSASAEVTVTDGITPEDLVTCLTDAGLNATATDTTMMGVEDPHEKVEVDELEGYDGEKRQGADLWVFADPGAAADNASYITLGGSDDPTNNRFEVAQNVVLTFDIITAAQPTTDEVSVLSCLPS